MVTMITTTTTPPTPPAISETTARSMPFPVAFQNSSSSLPTITAAQQQHLLQPTSNTLTIGSPRNAAHRHSTAGLDVLPSTYSSSTALPTPPVTRKFSASLAALQTTAVGLLNADVAGLQSARRRISNVSDAVSRKLSNTIGWKTPAVPSPDIIAQGRCLCGQYVRGRLRRAGVYNKKMGLHRMRSGFANGVTLTVVREVYPALSCLGEELERLHPKLYTNVARQVTSRGSGGDIPSTENASYLLSTIARDLFRADITWGKVVALFSVAGGLALDCVRQGHPEFVPKLIESMSDVIDDELVVWIAENGGWIGLNVHLCPETSEFSLAESTCLALAALMGICLLVFVLKFIGFRLIPWMLLGS